MTQSHRHVACLFAWLFALASALNVATLDGATVPDEPIQFNRDVRGILSNKCYMCHGPDEGERHGGGESGLRLDTPAGALEDLGGYAAIVPGQPAQSALLERVMTADEDLRMPPAAHGPRLTSDEVKVLRQWIEQGASYAQHWSYAPVRRPELPEIAGPWPRNAIDHFIAARHQARKLRPNPEADRETLLRRVCLDLTGLPPTLEQRQRFLADSSNNAYERLVDRLLDSPAYGEHWARQWLDLARYADSAGYADDPPRTIWAFRDYVIRSFNHNKPFDQFTVEQIAGDLLPDPSPEQLIATAFHRNTLTNNEGGTNDEEFRNVAVVDRVNTTLAVWMGTTMACAQCHSHKYDPISQQDYFATFAIFNNTEDADKRDERPLLEVYSTPQKAQIADLQRQITALRATLGQFTPELERDFVDWVAQRQTPPEWHNARAIDVRSAAKRKVTLDATRVVVAGEADTDQYHVRTEVHPGRLTGLQISSGIQTLASPKNFVITGVKAWIRPLNKTPIAGRFIRIELPGDQRILSLAEVQVWAHGENIARQGQARQSSVDFGGPAELAIDGNTSGVFQEKSTTHTRQSANPWWELDLQATHQLESISIWNRTDGNVANRLDGYRIAVLDEHRREVWKQTIAKATQESQQLAVDGTRELTIARAFADYAQPGFGPEGVLNPQDTKTGWAVGGAIDRAHQLTLVLDPPVDLAANDVLELRIDQSSPHQRHTLDEFEVRTTGDPSVLRFAELPTPIVTLLTRAVKDWTEADASAVRTAFLEQTPTLEPVRKQLASLQRQRDAIKPTTVPIMRELSSPRVTHFQFRGNYLDQGPEVSPGLPKDLFDPMASDWVETSVAELASPPTRLTLARWLVHPRNPLTPRVLVNRYWEQLFGIGIVRTSEEFGSQGELPSHPELLDWLASELVSSGWDVKHLVRLLVTSATYRQQSAVTAAALERDPDNRLLARGPRFRLSAETIRDQALAASGLLSDKMYGPPVRPPQPALGVKAAFGSGIDWTTSTGPDRYRRGIYTTWRRSNPYPSMVTFDAPNREVCTIRRVRTNTPLQALVTLNDPVFIEAAQSLARLCTTDAQAPPEVIRTMYLRCLCREPKDAEQHRLLELFADLQREYTRDPAAAKVMATEPLGPWASSADLPALAAWTVIANVILNLDETLMKR